eukprot:jgi/Ulvmu1/2768/UM014_0226.1
MASQGASSRRRASTDMDVRPAGVPKRISSLSQQVDAFVQNSAGTKPIYSILVANNGIAAVKFIRSIRKWAYTTFGSDKAICLVTMATHIDIKSNAEHIHMADQFVEVPGGGSAENYGNVKLIAQIASQAAVDAVWPGWGHASEKPDLPRILEEQGITFLGPREAAMAALGDKIASTILAQSAGVPTLPWSGSGVSMPLQSSGDVTIPDVIYQSACVHSVDEAVATCQVVGYPAMLKASWGGGGKGIRRVCSDEEVRLLYKQVRGEVPGSPVFSMRLAPQSRHLEVQLLCDCHGAVVSLYTRDCSIQRRHQKIIEEGPATIATPGMVQEMEACARRLASSVGYVGAATVEFLYVLQEKRFYFLELNPRLQVEHPVTEWLSGVNIPACQVMIGMGIPLLAMPEIAALYPGGMTGESPEQVPPTGHVVAARITSEHAEDGFKPTCGTIDELHFRSTPEVWGYFSVRPGSKVHAFSDSQFGHVFAKGENRAAAVRAMVVALKELRIRGEIRTLVDYVADMLQEPAFVGNNIHTGWLDGRIAAQVRVERPPWHLSVIAGAVDAALNQASANVSEYLKYLEKGQAAPTALSMTTFTVDLTLEADKFRLTVHRAAPDMLRLHLNHSAVDVGARKLSDGSILIQVDGCAHIVHAEKEVTGTRLIIDNLTCLLPNEHDPSSLRAPSPGKLLRFLVQNGASVEQDEPFAEMEAMKQIMLMIAPARGTVQFAVPEGRGLSGGELVATLHLENPQAICTGRPFTGGFPEIAEPQVVAEGLHSAFHAALQKIDMIITGYVQDAGAVVQQLVDVVVDPNLPFAIWDEQWATLQATLPSMLVTRLSDIVEAHRHVSADAIVGSPGLKGREHSQGSSACCSWDANVPLKGRGSMGGVSEGPDDGFPSRQLQQVISVHIKETPIKEQRIVESATAGALAALQQLDGGPGALAWHTARNILDKFLASEAPFLDRREMSEADAIDALRKEHSSDLQHVLNVILSHQALPRKAHLVLAVLDTLVAPVASHVKLQLAQLAALPTAAPLGKVVQRAQQLLDHALLSELSVAIASALMPLTATSSADTSDENSGHKRTGSVVDVASTAVGDLELESLEQAAAKVLHDLQNRASLIDRLAVLVNAPAAIEEAVALVLGTRNQELHRAACLAYIHRLYSAFLVTQPAALSCNLSGYQWRYEAAISSGATGEAPCTGVLLLPHSLEELPEMLSTLSATQKLRIDVVHVVHDPSMRQPQRCSSSIAKQAYFVDVGTVSQGMASSPLQDAPALDEAAAAAVQACSKQLLDLGVANVSMLGVAQSLDVHRVGFRAADGEYERAPILSFIEPPTACMLETDTLPPVLQYVPSYAHQLHTFLAKEKSTVSSQFLHRAFMRVVIRRISTPDLLSALYQQHATRAATAAIAEAEAVLPRCLNELHRLSAQSSNGPADWVHIFVSLLPPLPLGGEADSAVHVAAALRAAAAQAVAHHAAALRRVAVAEWTIRIRSAAVSGAQEASRGWRVVVSLPSGHESGEDNVTVLEELVADGGVRLQRTGRLPRDHSTHAVGSILAPVPALSPLQQRRLQARRHSTTYCYDFPAVFEDALRSMWADHEADAGQRPQTGALVEATELVMQSQDLDHRLPDAPLVPVTRPIGSNDVGVVVWAMTLRTPEWPHGRQIIAIANDITFQAGALSPGEHAMFRAAADLAHKRQLPLVYLAANSGAKVGLDQGLKSVIQVKWVSDDEPWKGFEYLYLSDADYKAALEGCSPEELPFRAVAHHNTSSDNVVNWRLTDIVGSEDGVGVECLSGSAATASAFSRGFEHGFTITLVTGRTVGIGAYLARLGRRVIQRADQPIILTGFQALNKLLGRPVYSSQMQLGGPRVMACNGVSHLVVQDDLQGAKAILEWLAYVPLTVGGEHTIHDVSVRHGGDAVPRHVTYVPPPGQRFNLREAVTGCSVDGEWAAGLFDRGSWREYHSGWAQTVITGRARLEGHPVAVLGVESQTVTVSVPADPGMPSSSEQQLSQAGQVWYPDSAQKTASALQEYDREGLPLIILANWRGFSGGKRDLFEGVLQAGARIVESLRQYRWPVTVYMPPGCDLRGGAWVVIDSQINPSMVEMYADPTARGNVLEPEGLVEIKFRKKDLLTLMSRCDPELRAMETASPRDQASLDAAILARQEQLLPVYHSIAVHFAAMHDTPRRMVKKGVLKAIVPWVDARRVLATRLRRRLAEDAVRAHVASADPSMQRGDALQLIEKWFAWSALDDSHGLHTAGNGCMSQSGSSAAADLASCDPEQGHCDHDELVIHDEHFLAWLNSAQGAAKIGTELKKLKRNAAATTVLGVAKSQEGREGLLLALESLLETNLSLKAQLASMIGL